MATNSSPLASQAIKFFVEGLDQVKDAFDAVRDGLGTIDDAVDDAVGHLFDFQTELGVIPSVVKDAVANAANALAGSAGVAHAQLEVLRASLSDSTYQEFAADLLKINIEMQRLQQQAQRQANINVFGSLVNKGVYDELQRMGNAIEAASTRLGVMKEMVSTGAYAQYAANLARINAEMSRLTGVTDELQRMSSAVEAADTKLSIMRELVASGQYGKYAADLARINAEMDKVRRAGDWQAMVAQHGVLGASLIKLRDGLNSVAGSAQKVLQTVAASPVAIGAAVVGFQMLRDKMEGWARAGMAGTNYGNLISMQFTMLSQQIAGIFVPIMQKVIDILYRLTNWFRQLSGDQQALIRNLTIAAGVMVIAHNTIGRMTGALTSMAGSILAAVIPAFQALVTIVTTGSLTIASALSLATAGISLLIGLLIAGATAAGVLGAGIVAGTSSGQAAITGLVEALQPLWTTLKNIYNQVKETLGPLLDALGETVGGIAATLAEALSGAFMDMLPIIVSVAEALAAGALVVADFVKSLIDGAVQIVNAFGGIRTIFYTIVGIVTAITTTLIGVFAPVLVVIALVAANLAAAFAPVFIVIAAIGAAISGLIYLLMPTIRALGELFDPIMASLRAFWQVAVEVVKAVIDAFASMFGDMGGMFDSINGTLVEFVHWLGEMIPRAANVMIQALASITDGLAGLMSWFDRLFGTNLEERLHRLAERIRGIRVNLSLDESRLSGRSREERPRTDVLPAGGHFEQAMDLFRRINEAAVKGAVEEENRRRAEHTNELLEEIRDNTRRGPVRITPVGTFSPTAAENVKEAARAAASTSALSALGFLG